MATKQTNEEKQGKLIDQLIETCTTNPDLGINDRLFKVSKALLSEIDSYTGTKETEKHLLDMLECSDGYFKAEFTTEEIARMKYNIASDFPIFLETGIGGLQARLEAAISESADLHSAIQDRDTRIENVEIDNRALRLKLDAILDNLVCTDVNDSGKIESAISVYNKNQVIMAKLNAGIALTAEEIKNVSSRITLKY